MSARLAKKARDRRALPHEFSFWPARSSERGSSGKPRSSGVHRVDTKSVRDWLKTLPLEDKYWK